MCRTKAQSYSALFHDIQQHQRQQQQLQLSSLQRQHGAAAVGEYSSPSSPYVSDDDDDDDDEQRHCGVTAGDLDLARRCVDLGRLRSASVDGIAHV